MDGVMADVKFDAVKTWQVASELYDKRQFAKCADKLEEIIGHTDDPEAAANLTNVKAGVYIDAQDIPAARIEVDKALILSPYNYQANYTKARLCYFIDSDLPSALEHINNSVNNFSLDGPDDDSQTSTWVQTFISTRSEIHNLKTSIESDMRSNEIFDRIKATEDRIDEKLRDERTRSIEVVGVFSAILALILTTVQGSLELRGPEFLWLALGMVVPISFMVLLVSPKADIKGKTLIQFIVFILGCIVIGVFIDRWFFG